MDKNDRAIIIILCCILCFICGMIVQYAIMYEIIEIAGRYGSTIPVLPPFGSPF